MDAEELLILGAVAVAGFWIFQHAQGAPGASLLPVPTPPPGTPVQAPGTAAPGPVINSATPALPEGATCSYGPPCNPGQACSMMAIVGTWHNGQCVPVQVAV